MTVQELKYTPIFFDLEVSPKNWRPPNSTVTGITAFSPLNQEQHFRESVAFGQLAKVWKRFLDWASGTHRERKIVLIAHNAYNFDAHIISRQVDSSVKWFDTVLLLKKIHRDRRVPNPSFKLDKLSAHYNIKEENHAFNDVYTLSLIFNKMILPLSSMDGYRLISTATDNPNAHQILAEAIKKTFIFFEPIVTQTIEISKAPYKLSRINNKIKLQVKNGNIWKDCISGSITEETEQSLRVFFRNAIHTFKNLDEFLPVSISLFEEYRWNSADSNEERLNLIQQRLLFCDKEEIDFDVRFACIFSLTIMTHPQKLIGGASLIPGSESHRFEYKNILQWLSMNATNPLNRLPLREEDLAPDKALENQIRHYLDMIKEEVFPWATYNYQTKKTVEILYL